MPALLVPPYPEVETAVSVMKDYPPSQSPASFKLECIQKKIEATMSGR